MSFAHLSFETPKAAFDLSPLMVSKVWCVDTPAAVGVCSSYRGEATSSAGVDTAEATVVRIPWGQRSTRGVRSDTAHGHPAKEKNC